MLNFKNIQAVIARLIISFICGNTALINSKLKPLLDTYIKTIILWNKLGVLVFVMKNDKGRWVLTFRLNGKVDGVSLSTAERIFEIPLGSNEHPINKRVINGLNVWYHANLREHKVHFDNTVANGVNQLDIRPFIKDFSIFERLTGKVKKHALSVGNDCADHLFDVIISIRRSLFNHLVVNVSVSSEAIGTNRSPNLLEEMLPVYFGVQRQFDANAEKEPVNKYVREAILDHLDHNLS